MLSVFCFDFRPWLSWPGQPHIWVPHASVSHTAGIADVASTQQFVLNHCKMAGLCPFLSVCVSFGESEFSYTAWFRGTKLELCRPIPILWSLSCSIFSLPGQACLLLLRLVRLTLFCNIIQFGFSVTSLKLDFRYYIHNLHCGCLHLSATARARLLFLWSSLVTSLTNMQLALPTG